MKNDPSYVVVNIFSRLLQSWVLKNSQKAFAIIQARFSYSSKASHLLPKLLVIHPDGRSKVIQRRMGPEPTNASAWKPKEWRGVRQGSMGQQRCLVSGVSTLWMLWKDFGLRVLCSDCV